MTPLTVVLAAEEAAGVQTLRFLLGGPHRIAGVLTGKGDGAVGAAAQRAGCPVWPARLVRDASFADTVRQHDVDLLLNVHSLFVVHPAVVAAPRIGSFNVHPGLLPAYAGLNAPSWAIYHGERAHGVTVHWMDDGIDTGAIAYQATFDIADRDTGYTLSAKCTRAAVPLLQQLVAAAAHDGGSAIPRTPQPAGPRRYFGREAPEQGLLDWSAPARHVVDFVRAADYSPFTSPWGHPRAWVEGGESPAGPLAVVRAELTGTPAREAPGTVGEAVGGARLVAAGDEWVAVQRVHVNGALADGRAALERGQRLTVGPLVAPPEV